MKEKLKSSFHGRKVLITGHTGFKGGWLTLMLNRLGAEIVGYSLDPPTEPSFFKETNLDNVCNSINGDILDKGHLNQVMNDIRPEIVFHLAAQPLVIESYKDPVETFNANVMGTVNVLESVRHSKSVQACVCITSDKCYENRETGHAYCETDRLGGHDPYSTSKAAAELVIASYTRSFPKEMPPTASVRAGNVIGGGDWAMNRIVPDIIKCLIEESPITLRNPQAIRPWQHVLDPLNGYLTLASRLMASDDSAGGAWNFGPGDRGNFTVLQVVETMSNTWGTEIPIEIVSNENFKESGLLHLDCMKANSQLDWAPVMDFCQAIKCTVEWYKAWASGDDMHKVTIKQIDNFWGL